MSIASIKPTMLLPEQELILGKSFTLQGKPALIVSITEQSGVVKLWIFQQIPETKADYVITEDYMPPCRTNRDEIQRRTHTERVGCKHFSEIAIQGITLPISQSTFGRFENAPMNYMKLQHFIEKGIDLSSIENISFEDLFISEYQLAEGTAFPAIDTDADMLISLSTQEESIEVLVEPSHVFHLNIGEQSESITRSFIDPVSGKEIVYYIDRIVRHDIWKEVEDQLHNEETRKIWREHGLDDAAIEEMRLQLPDTLGHICPKGQVMLLIQYESLNNVQLNFYPSEFLSSVPIPNSNNSVLMTTSGEGESMHGLPARMGLLKTVPANFDEPVDVELVSWYRQIPGEKILV